MSKPTTMWNQQQEKGSFKLLRFMLWCYQTLGRGFFQFILSIVIWWYWLFAQTARRHSTEYLQRLHQFAGVDSPFQVAPTSWSSYQHLYQFGESILDKIAGWNGDIPEQELCLYGHEHFRRYYQKGAIIIVSHFGNIELLRAVKSDHVQVVNVLVYRKHAQQFNEFLKSINPKAAVRLISVDDLGMDTAFELQQCLDAGEWVVIAADRIPLDSKRQQTLPFLGEQADWPEGAWLLAHLLEAPVLACFCYPKAQHIEVHIHLLAENLNLPRKNRGEILKQYMQSYVSLVEQHCLRAPYQWFNFYNFWK